MRRIIGASSAVLAALAVAATALAASGANVTVAPKHGTTHTTFTVSFTAPNSSGHHGSLVYQYVVMADGLVPHNPNCAPPTPCCRSQASARPTAHAGQRVHTKLLPGRRGWCPPVFHGRVNEVERPYCHPHKPCPKFIRIVDLGHFSFRVKASHAGHAAPKFAGLKSATQCFPGPVHPNEKQPVFLAWNAAKPRKGTAYEIFMSATAGGEHFSHPNWSTRRLEFRTPALPAGRYFVVRARDRAGQEDHNRVEHLARNKCV